MHLPGPRLFGCQKAESLGLAGETLRMRKVSTIAAGESMICLYQRIAPCFLRAAAVYRYLCVSRVLGYEYPLAEKKLSVVG